MIQFVKRSRTLLALAVVALVAGIWISSRTDAAATPGTSATTAAADGNAKTAPQYPMDWTLTGPLGGDVRSLVVDPRDPQHLFFGTIDGQIYTTTDGGQKWARLVGFNHPGLLIDRLIIDSRDSNTLYVGAHRHKDPGGFFKTTDGGATWHEAAELKDEAVHSLAQSPSNPDILVAGTNRGVFRSTNAGDTWEQLPTSAYPDLINVESLAFDPRSSDSIYAGTWHLPWKTDDGGRSWKSIKTGIIDDSDVFAIAIDKQKPDHVIASACSGIYDSRNAGENFRKVQGIPSQSRRTRAILQNPALHSVIYAGTTEGFWRSLNGGETWMLTTSRLLEINAIAIHPKNPETVYIGTNNYGVMVSHDNGRTFVTSNGGYSGRRAYCILPDREKPGRVYATTINTATGGGFFFVSDDDGATWKASIHDMPSRLIAYSILQDERDGQIIYLGTNYGMYESSDRGASWAPLGLTKKPPVRPRGRRSVRRGAVARRAKPAPAPDTAANANAPMTAAPALSKDDIKHAQEALAVANYDVGSPDGGVGPRTTAAIKKFQMDHGLPQTGIFDDATLTALGLGAQAAGKQLVVARLTEPVIALSYTYDKRDERPGILAATNTGLYRTYDPEKSWEKITYGNDFDVHTLCISVNKQNPQNIYVGTASSGVLVTRDGGATWQEVEGVPKQAPINIIVQDMQHPSNIYVGTTQTLYITHDGGEKWLRRGGNLPYGSYTSVLINPQNSDELFVGSAYENIGGMFRSTDAGMTWQRVDPDLPSRRIWALVFDPSNPGKIFVGTHSAGVYVAQHETGSATATSSSEN